jgi:hypothetical protein
MIEEVQQAVASALGGEIVTMTTVEGCEHYSLNVLSPQIPLRSDPQAIASDILMCGSVEITTPIATMPWLQRAVRLEAMESLADLIVR